MKKIYREGNGRSLLVRVHNLKVPRTSAQLYRTWSPAESSTGGREAPLHTAEITRSNRRPQISVNAVDPINLLQLPPLSRRSTIPLKIPGSQRDPDQLQNLILYFARHTPTPPRKKTNQNSSTTFWVISACNRQTTDNAKTQPPPGGG